ncbi:kinase-like domain-containing protein [Piptocephalis cylindrospora]|uniref:non-specific serine/threonine protein kinase n=1 Tax=Piptocephalis cylindrospora TaxID=1907219 RepID=A0A4P9Y5Z1_9FUNG|nr:kinase-like domain-containing protein [Piptocephalis cylindrospora]|eukprot:RKP13240.1 kinase-like domain-containing protein [Piptocephalis cylindrospora]
MACCLPVQTLHINSRTFKVTKLLGEGGFSVVYLVQDVATTRLYACKKIYCPDGTDSVKEALKEAETYRMFTHPNIIRILDVCVVQGKDGSKTVYIFLPYYRHGTLQDSLPPTESGSGETGPTERSILRMFRGVAYAVRALHDHELPEVPARRADSLDEGYGMELEERDVDGTGAERHVAYAHRDIKPGNVLIADDGMTPILMDFGSMQRARIHIRTRQQGLFEQDKAAEQCSMAYRAPELFDIKTGTRLDERVDIWSLGCLLYAQAYGESPFDVQLNQQGGSVAMAVQNGRWSFPPGHTKYSKGFQELIRFMLVVEPRERPSIHQVIDRLDALLLQTST